ncbi:MAG: TIGR04282 family arsenosugar biosynthesis glycosyltransferase [Rhodospirillaceae bacterium]
MVRPHLVIFAKEPRIGRVKTRLARDIGSVAAWAFYRRQVAAAAARLQGPGRWRTWLAVSPDRAIFRERIWPGGVARISQGAGDLGDRMARIMAVLPPGPVVIVGTDVPGIRSAHIRGAFARLGRRDAVIGPAADGGYWLIGLRRRPRIADPFTGVRWSTRHAIKDTLANLKGLSVGRLEVLEDVDDGGDYKRFLKARKAKRCIPNTEP